MKLSNRDFDKISLHCHAVAVHHFAMFHNPKYRGPKFTWNKFPEILAEHCETQAFCICPNERKTKAYREHGRKTGLELGQKMVKWMMTE